MPIHVDHVVKTKMDSERVNGAGILLFCNHNGNIHFLLARESFSSKWNLPWSGFEGGSKSSEDVYETAAREFIEESMGIIPNWNTVDAVLVKLRAGDYFSRIDLVVENKTKSDMLYTTFMVQIKYEPYLLKQFSNTRKMMRYIHAITKPLPQSRWTEANTNEWITVMTSNREKELKMFIKSNPHLFEVDNPCIIHSPTITCSYEGIRKTLINKDCLEKDVLMYWPLDDVIHCLRSTTTQRNKIKPFFIPTLFLAADHLKRCQAGDTLPLGYQNIIECV